MSARRSSRSITIVRGSRGARILRPLVAGTFSCGTGFSGSLRSLTAGSSGSGVSGPLLPVLTLLPLILSPKLSLKLWLKLPGGFGW
jgi:hypothetical protein